jgi:recombination protein RecA
MAKAKKSSAKKVRTKPSAPKANTSLAALMATALSTKETPITVYRADEVITRNVMSTGFMHLDMATGAGGLVMGRIVIFHGKEGCGKTTLAIQVGIQAQRRGGLIVYFDYESKLDLPYVKQLGADMDSFVHITPAHIEEGMNQLEKCLKEMAKVDPDLPVVFVWDSVSSATSKFAHEHGFGETKFPPEAKVYAQGLRKVARIVNMGQALLIGITQKKVKIDGHIVSDKIGVGNAWVHHAYMIIKWVSKQMPDKAKVSGSARRGTQETWKVEVVKNQAGDPMKTASLQMNYGRGYDPAHSVLMAGLDLKLVDKSGASYAFDNERFGASAESAVKAIAEDEHLRDRLISAIEAKLSGGALEVEGVTDEGEWEDEDEEEDDGDDD